MACEDALVHLSHTLTFTGLIFQITTIHLLLCHTQLHPRTTKLKMHHQDGLSVYFEDLHKQRFEEFRIAAKDQPRNDKANVVRSAFNMPSRTSFKLFLHLSKNFELLGATGLKVTIAIGRDGPEPFSPDNVQSWWVPQADIQVAKESALDWEKLWTWKRESNMGFSRAGGAVLRVPQPSSKLNSRSQTCGK